MTTEPTIERHEALLSALAAAFSTRSRARLLLRQAGLPVDLLDLSLEPRPLWEAALALAEARGMVEELRASAASHHPEVGVFLHADGSATIAPAAAAPANALRKLVNVLTHNYTARDRARLLSELGVPCEPALAEDPRAAAEAVAAAGALRELWDKVRDERPRVLPLPWPAELPAPEAP